MRRHAIVTRFHERALRSSSIALLCGAMFTVGCTTTPPRAGGEAIPQPQAGMTREKAVMEARDDSDATVASFLAALQGRDFARAAASFDGTMKHALPREKLAAVWDSQVGALGALGTWEIVQRAHADGKDVRIALLTFERGELQALISVNPATQELAGLFFKPVAKATGPAPYVNPARFRSEDVEVGTSPYLLKGTFAIPVGRGPFPAVVLVHGSGPNDRDGSIGANKPYKDIAEGLASRGVAVLRYDKRTFQYGHQLTNHISIDDEVVLDAVSAVKLLKARPEVDARRVVVAGHSLGALLAPEVAVRSAPVAGIVLLAPPGRAPWDAVIGQLRYLETPADTLAEVERAVELLKAGQLGAGTLLGAPASYWQDWAARDGVAMARKVRAPILVLRGERDYQVTDEDVATWRKGLKGVPRAELVSIPEANHLFIRGTGKPNPAEYGVPGHVDVTVIDRLASFVSGACDGDPLACEKVPVADGADTP
jgi:dienelactone hydrolase